MPADDTFRFRRHKKLSQRPVEGVGRRILSARFPRSQRSSRRVCIVLPRSGAIPPTQWVHGVSAPPRPICRSGSRAFSLLGAALEGPELGVAEPSEGRILPLRDSLMSTVSAEQIPGASTVFFRPTGESEGTALGRHGGSGRTRGRASGQG